MPIAPVDGIGPALGIAQDRVIESVICEAAIDGEFPQVAFVHRQVRQVVYPRIHIQNLDGLYDRVTSFAADDLADSDDDVELSIVGIVVRRLEGKDARVEVELVHVPVAPLDLDMVRLRHVIEAGAEQHDLIFVRRAGKLDVRALEVPVVHEAAVGVIEVVQDHTLDVRPAEALLPDVVLGHYVIGGEGVVGRRIQPVGADRGVVVLVDDGLGRAGGDVISAEVVEAEAVGHARDVQVGVVHPLAVLLAEVHGAVCGLVMQVIVHADLHPTAIAVQVAPLHDGGGAVVDGDADDGVGDGHAVDEGLAHVALVGLGRVVVDLVGGGDDRTAGDLDASVERIQRQSNDLPADIVAAAQLQERGPELGHLGGHAAEYARPVVLAGLDGHVIDAEVAVVGQQRIEFLGGDGVVVAQGGIVAIHAIGPGGVGEGIGSGEAPIEVAVQDDLLSVEGRADGVGQVPVIVLGQAPADERAEGQVRRLVGETRGVNVFLLVALEADGVPIHLIDILRVGQVAYLVGHPVAADQPGRE